MRNKMIESHATKKRSSAHLRHSNKESRQIKKSSYHCVKATKYKYREPNPYPRIQSPSSSNSSSESTGRGAVCLVTRDRVARVASATALDFPLPLPRPLPLPFGPIPPLFWFTSCMVVEDGAAAVIGAATETWFGTAAIAWWLTIKALWWSRELRWLMFTHILWICLHVPVKNFHRLTGIGITLEIQTSYRVFDIDEFSVIISCSHHGVPATVIRWENICVPPREQVLDWFRVTLRNEEFLVLVEVLAIVDTCLSALRIELFVGW